MNRLKTAIVGLAAVIGIALAVFQTARVGSAPARQVAAARAWAGLAPLPPSATQVRASEEGAFTWTAYYVRFSAPPEDINAFLAASPGLRGERPEIFTARHKLLPGPARGQSLTARQLTDGNSYILYGLPSPSWFDRTVRTSGRRYNIHHGGNYGEVVVNDASHTVYVYVADS